jgi:hypothetical protein
LRLNFGLVNRLSSGSCKLRRGRSGFESRFCGGWLGGRGWSWSRNNRGYNPGFYG